MQLKVLDVTIVNEYFLRQKCFTYHTSVFQTMGISAWFLLLQHGVCLQIFNFSIHHLYLKWQQIEI